MIEHPFAFVRITLALFSAMLLSTMTLAGDKATKSSSASDSTVVPTMRKIYDAMAVVLPLSLQGEAFVKSDSRKKISKQLRVFEKNAKNLQRHFTSGKVDEAYVATSLARDAREARKLYENGHYPQARFIIHHVAANCISCHTKLPSHNRRTMDMTLFDQLKKSDLSHFELAQFQTMTRDFDKALKQYEEGLWQNLAAIDGRRFTEYLKVSIRVKQDMQRVDQFLAKVQAKKPLPTDISQVVGEWRKALHTVGKRKWLVNDTMGHVRKLVKTGEKRTEAGFRNEGSAHFIAASGMASRMLTRNAPKMKRAEKAELYFLLGRTELHFANSFWLSEAENYLEQAIRMSPRSGWARQAFELLEETYMVGYTGSSGTHLPDDVAALLTDLRQLVGLSSSKAKTKNHL